MAVRERHERGTAKTDSPSSKFIHENRNQILADCESAFLTMPIAKELDRVELMNHVPEVLAQIAEVADQLASGLPPSVDARTAAHAIDRMIAGFDVAQVVIEIELLKDCITRRWEDRIAGPEDFRELRILNQAVDLTAASIIDQYTTARDRTFHVLDRIAKAALESRSLDDLLGRLLRIASDTSKATIDVSAILVREGDLLRIRASEGLERAGAGHFCQRVGEGFAGTIALTATVHELAGAATQPFLESRDLRNSGVQGLYGVPLVEGGQVVAVAYIGSRSTSEFSRQDKFLFGLVAARASAAVLQHMLREAAERASRVLRERELEFRGLADNISQLAWIADATGRLYWYNRRWLDYTGTTLEHMRVTGPEDYIHPDHRHRVVEGFQEAVATGAAWEDTFPMRDKNGAYRWFLTRVIPICDETGKVARWFGTNTDVTEQRFLDETTKILNSSLDYAATLERIAQLVVPTLADWCFVDLAEPGTIRRVATLHANAAQLEVVREIARKYPPDWNEVKGITKVIRTGITAFGSEVQDEALVAYAQNAEHLAAMRAMQLKSYIIAPLTARGRTIGAISLMTTSESERRYGTADVNLANELGRRAGIAVDNARLYEASQQLLREREEALRWREEVLAMVSHDLRGPLATIELVASNLLDELDASPHARKQLEGIQRSGVRMDRMINDLLDTATIQANGLTLTMTLEEPERILSAIVEAHEAVAAQKGMMIERTSELGSVLVSCDRDRLEQVFGNLLGNALKYCRRGDTISLRGHVVGNEVELSVADTGPGISPEEIPHLFEPYWAAKRRQVKTGTGLGLYICKGIIEAHGGSVWAESDAGHGTTFTFRLPIAKSAEPGRVQPDHDQPATSS